MFATIYHTGDMFMKGLRFLHYSLAILLAMCLFLPCQSLAQIEEMIDTKETRDIVMFRGDIVSLKVYSLTRIAISTPGIVDIVNADVDEILLSGKAIGQTQIFIWDEYGKRSVLARVMEQDISMVKERIEQLLAAAEIEGITLTPSLYEGKLIATGKVNKVQKEGFDQGLADLEGIGDFVINLVDAQGDLIQIDAQIIEVSAGWDKELGVKWTNLSAWTFTKTANDLIDALKFGTYDNTDNPVKAVINAALTEANARDIARPSIVVSDGEEASILVGGEVPITKTTVSDGLQTEDVTYKPYGVQLNVTPSIMDDDKIDITLNVTISDTDSGPNAIEGSFTTTTAQTKVLLDDGQTIIIAGLIQKAEEDVTEKVPFLHRIPILGKFLFTHKKELRMPDTEVIISLTPRLRRQKNKLKTKEEIQKEEELLQKKKEVEEGMDEFGLKIKDDSVLQGDDKKVEMDEFGLKIKDDSVLEGGNDIQVPAGEGKIVNQEKTMAEEQADLDKMLESIESNAAKDLSLMEEGVSEDISKYARDVQQKIAQRISFPLQAKEEGWEGTVTLSLTILSDGTLNNSSVKNSSGRNIFDEDALTTAKIVSPFDPFPAELEMDEITVAIPVVYNQDVF